MPPKPKTAAIIETTRKIKAHFNNDMDGSFLRKQNRRPAIWFQSLRDPHVERPRG
jgi:hypothetical protein